MPFLIILSLLSVISPQPESHDISAYGAWGPYSKEYSGVSHISDISSGCRVDFTLVPGFYRRTANVPNELFEDENGCYPWNFSSDFHSWTYRHEIEWKDRVYVDASYDVLDGNRVLLEMHCVNGTDAPQDLLLHNILFIRHDDNYPEASADCDLVGGTDYISYEPSVCSHDYSLVYDGWLRGERRDRNSLTGSVLETSGNPGDAVVYRLTDTFSSGASLRWKAASGESVCLKINGEKVTLEGSGRYELLQVTPVSGILEIETCSSGRLTIDAILLSRNPVILQKLPSFVPALEEHDGWFTAKFEDDTSYYGIASCFPYEEINQYVDSNLDVFLRRMVHRHNQNYFEGDGRGHYTSLFQRPVSLPPHKDTTIYNLIVCGAKDFVEHELSSFRFSESLFAQGHATVTRDSAFLPGAEKYAHGYRIIRSNLLNNIVYPVWTQGQYIRHFTPGKNWNSLYTWDSGFICWAMSELNPSVAEGIVHQYTTDERSQSAFIHHGTPLPIHLLAFKDILQNSVTSDSLCTYYPRLKRFFDFMVGESPGSTTLMPSGLIRTWDYFYNSGGWDDYPPQHALRFSPELYSCTAPAVQTSFYIRAARIMRSFAEFLGFKADVRYYDSMIRRMSSALQKFSWDPSCGYFSYVLHDENGIPSGFYRWMDGSNFNMGLDGVSPLVAGICTKEQEDTLICRIFSPEHLWSDAGISTVDRSAPYYTLDGYWNGCVWMPHQFVLWKTMLDLGRPDLAEKIAYTALDTWERETEISYRSFEHFMISSLRGKGWHNFSGLSSPVVNWFCSYFVPGKVSTGFDVFISDVLFSKNNDSFSASLRFDKDCKGQSKTIILCMNPGYGYEAKYNGKSIPVVSSRPGLLYVSVPAVYRPELAGNKLSISMTKLLANDSH